MLFSGTVEVAVPPTHERERVREAVKNIELQPSTAIGEAIFSSLKAIKSIPGAGKDAPPARIVLLSDGSTNAGRPNEDAVDAAKQASVPVSTIAFGTDDGTVVLDGVQEAVPVNRDALRDIADRHRRPLRRSRHREGPARDVPGHRHPPRDPPREPPDHHVVRRRGDPVRVRRGGRVVGLDVAPSLIPVGSSVACGRASDRRCGGVGHIASTRRADCVKSTSSARRCTSCVLLLGGARR